MRRYVKKLLADYPEMLHRRAELKQELGDIKPFTEEDVISSMTFFQPEGERVQTSNISRKTESVALNYRDRFEKMNRKLYGSLPKDYNYVNGEITFLEESIRELPEDEYEVMSLLSLDEYTWKDVETFLAISIREIGRRRKSAINYLVRDYQQRASKIEARMLA